MKKIYHSLCLATVLTVASFPLKAQLAGTYSVPATFPSLAAAINSLNVGGVTGPVTILVNAGYTETAPVGGYTLTATGTNVNPIIFQKNGVGANPVISAYTGGAGTPATAVQDGIWRFIGSDYITINGIDLADPNVANPATMEFGYGFFKASATDGCQNNTIQNCVITLNRINVTAGTAPATDGSRGIDVVNALTSTHTTPITVASAAGANSNNRFYSNTIQNCNIGIALIGFADLSPFTNADQGNDVGGNNGSTGNNIINYGGGTGATVPAAGIRTLAQYSLNISYNTINSNNGGGVNHPNVLRGILVGAATSANLSITNNTVTVKGGGTTQAMTAIDNGAGATAAANAVSINNNLVTNCTYATATSGVFTGIVSSASSATLSISNNSLVSNATNATSGTHLLISNTGIVGSLNNMNNNLVNGFTFNSSSAGTLNHINNTGASSTSTLSMSNNTIQAVTHASGGSTSHNFIRNTSAAFSTALNNNRFVNLTLNCTGSVTFLTNEASLPGNGILNVNSNAIVTGFNKTGAGGTVTLFSSSSSLFSPSGSTKTEQNNNFSNITLTGATTMAGWLDQDGNPGPTKIITANTFTSWACGSSAVSGIQMNYSGDNTTVSSNTISGITSTGAFTGINIGSGNTATTHTFSGNVITNISCGGAMAGISGGAFGVTTVYVTNNTIGSFSTTAASALQGININDGSSVYIVKNKIYDLFSGNAGGNVNGLTASLATSVFIHNNIIGDLRTPTAAGANVIRGLNLTTISNAQVFYNTVRLSAVSSGANFGTSALFANTGIALNLRNNILINNSTAVGTGSTVAYRRSSTTLTSYSNTSNNNSFYAGTPGSANLLFSDGTNMLQTMATYTPFVSPRDANSITENTNFLSLVGANANFLHVDPSGGSITESAASNIPGITDDFDNQVRAGNIGYVGQGTAPDIGADEYSTVLPDCNAVTGASVSPASVSVCVGQTLALNATGFTAGNGITYQWQVGTTPGGPYSNVVGGLGGNGVNYQTPALGQGTFYYVLLTTCTISGQSAISINESTISVNAYPNVSVTPVTSTICVPGGSSVTLTGSGANTYSWSPAAGLDFTTGVSVQALPAGSTNYTVTGANLAGCTATALAVVNIATMPTIVGVTATPTLLCPGGTSSLAAVASLTNYAVSNITYSPIPTPTINVTTLASGGVAVVTPPIVNIGPLDDVAWNNLPIPFTFSLYGVGYSSFGISSNGFIRMDNGTFASGGYFYNFPSNLSANPSIGPNYSDLTFDYMGTIETFTTGVSPNRKLVVNWTGGQYFDYNIFDASGSITAQAILYETTNVIEFHVMQASGVSAAVQGIQNAGATGADVVPGRNNTTYTISTPDAYRFTPGSVTYTWMPNTFLNNAAIAAPVASNFTASINYTVDVIGSNGCVKTSTVSITADVAPTVAIAGGTVPVCSGNTVNLTASGADSYSWTNGPGTASISVSPSVTTAYTVVGTSTLNGCTASAIQNVTIHPTPVIAVTASNAICAGQSVALIASGAQTYTWANNGSTLSIIAVTPSVTTSYSVAGTSSAGCSGTTAIKTVTVYALPTVTIAAAPGFTICEGESVTLIASGNGVDTYSWSNGANSGITTATPGLVGPSSVPYTVTVINNSTGCSNSASTNILVRTCVGIEEHSGNITGLYVYPNPNLGQFTVELDNASEKTIEVSDVTGRILVAEKTDKAKTEININEFANGIYYVRIHSNKAVEVIKLVKQ